MDAWTLRPLDGSEEDLRFLAAMLYEAATWRHGERRPPAEVLADPQVGRYAAGWGREDDFGLVAVATNGERLGAGWWRLFFADAPGYGFVSERIPEMSIAVQPGQRGQGVGTALLEGLVAQARAGRRPALSLSVEGDNPAVRLYRRLGFRVVGDQAGDAGLTMLLEL